MAEFYLSPSVTAGVRFVVSLLSTLASLIAIMITLRLCLCSLLSFQKQYADKYGATLHELPQPVPKAAKAPKA